jgi:hypothetical protein
MASRNDYPGVTWECIDDYEIHVYPPEGPAWAMYYRSVPDGAGSWCNGWEVEDPHGNSVGYYLDADEALDSIALQYCL